MVGVIWAVWHVPLMIEGTIPYTDLVFVVASTCALSTMQRAREIGLLRTVGATPGQVRRLMYGETLVVAVFAGLVGAPAGALAAPLLAGPMIDAGTRAVFFDAVGTLDASSA